jgi:putative oxidoreductase
MFLMAGFSKSTQPIEQLSQMMPWTGQVPVGLVRFIGVSEFLGAVGLLLPSQRRIKPQLSVWAALGIATVMVLALIFHVVLSGQRFTRRAWICPRKKAVF